MSFTPKRTLALVSQYLESLATTQQTEQVSKVVRADLRKALRMHAPSADDMTWPQLIDALKLVAAQAATKQLGSQNPIVKNAFEGIADHLSAAIEIARTYVDAPATA